MPSRRIALLIALMFAVTLLVRFPARWVATMLPNGIECHEATGTIWNGECAQLRAAGTGLSRVGWRLLPAQLLRGTLAADIRSNDPRANGSLQLRVGSGGRLELRNVNARLQLAGGLIPALRDQWRGQVELALSRVELRALQPRALAGTARVMDLRQSSPPLELGSYELAFAEGAADNTDIVGALRDLQGPVGVAGSLRLRTTGEYEVDGTVVARPTASAELQRLIEFLGPVDAQGARPFSLAGTL
jgi:hypothetical protein